MSESLPTRPAISFENYVTDQAASIVSVTSAKNLFPKEELLNSWRSRYWRSTSSSALQRITIQMAGNRLPTVVALGNCNVDSGQTITLECASDSAITSNVASWSLTTYAQTKRNMLRWYLGAADSGTAAARLFWRWTLPANGSRDTDGDGTEDPYYQVGLIWMGAWTAIPLNGIRRDIVDPSIVTESDAGVRFVDRRQTYHAVEAGTPELDEATSYAIMDALDEGGLSRHVLFDLWPFETDAAKKANGCYYGTLGRGDDVARFQRRVIGYDDISWELVEARA